MTFTITNVGVDARAEAVHADARLTGWLATEGARIVDRDTGEAVRLVGANWFGAEGHNRVPNGLWERNYEEMMDEMLDAGINTLRIPISPGILDDVEPGGLWRGVNPDLVGLSPIEVMDAIIAHAGQIGLRVFLDMHRRDPGVGKQEDGLWFDEDYALADMARDWQAIASRYADDPTVVGYDLFNEPSGRGATRAHWGEADRPAEADWAAAAEVLGNAVLEVAPDALIIVQGVHIYEDQWYWVGGNLKGVQERPIVLDVEGRLVYSPHDYPYTVQNVPWLEHATSEEMAANFREHWGFIAERGIAPLLIGETGGHLAPGTADAQYLDALFAYMADIDAARPGAAPGVTWWGWNPNSHDTGGLLEADWRTQRADKMAYLEGTGAPLLPATEAALARLLDGEQVLVIDTGGTRGNDRVFTYEVAEVEGGPGGGAGGGAAAGRDFEPEAGVLHVPADARFAEIDVRVPHTALGGEDGPGAVAVTIFWPNGAVHSRHEVALDAPVPRGGEVKTGDGGHQGAGADGVVRADEALGEREVAITVGRDGEALDGSLRLGGADALTLTLDGAGLGAGTGYEVRLLDAGALRVVSGGASGGGDGVVVTRAAGEAGGRLQIELAVADMEAFVEAPELVWRAPAMGLDGTAHEGKAACGEGALRVSFEVESTWGDAFFGRITVHNAGEAAIEDWRLELDSFDFAVDEVHKAHASEGEGGALVIEGPSWDADLDAGERFTFGFDGRLLDERTDLDLAAIAREVEIDLF